MGTAAAKRTKGAGVAAAPPAQAAPPSQVASRSRARRREDPELGEIKALAVSPDGAAHLLGIARCTVYKLMDREELEWFPVGRGRRIAVSEIEAYMKRNAMRGRRVA